MGTDGVHSDPAILPDECYIDGKAYPLDQYKDSSNNSWTYVELQQTIARGKDSSSPNTTNVPIDCVFAMRLITYQSLYQFMISNPFFLDESGTSDSNTGVAGGVFSFYPNGGDLPALLANQVFGIEPLFNNGNASFQSINASFERLATAMTTYMRQNSNQQGVTDYTGLESKLAALAPSAPGVLFRSQTIVAVQWYWIILPAIVLLTTSAYLIAAVVQGGAKDRTGETQAHLWKSSALVPLVIGQKSHLPRSADALDEPQAMKALKKRRMKLINSKDGWALIDSDGHDSG
jgi:hypothetical protein